MRSIPGALALAALALALAGCAHSLSEMRTGPGTSASPAETWSPPPGTPVPPPASAPSAGIPPDLLEEARNLTLGQLVDLALRTNPVTRAAWAAARSAAAGLGSERSAYYPTVDLDVNATHAKGSAAGGTITFRQTSYGPVVSLDYLLLDLGGRRATVEEARQALIAANWRHNAAIQDVVLAVEDAYVQYVGTKALLEAQQTAVKEFQTNLDVAEQRHAAGVATIADVLQAKTALAQAQLQLDTLEGQIQTVKGSLATAVGVPANTPFDVEAPVNDLPLEQVSDDVDRLIEDAEARRPDLAAARSEVAKAESHVVKVRSEGLPTLDATGALGRGWYQDGGVHQDTYSAAILFRVPLFTGFSQKYKVLQARADEEAARADLELRRQQVVYEVWNSYYGLKTAAQKVQTAASLVESATQSNEVALGRYKAGVGTIIDLLVAQTGLTSARAQQVVARAEWFLSLAHLLHDVGAPFSQPGSSLDAPPPAGGATRTDP